MVEEDGGFADTTAGTFCSDRNRRTESLSNLPRHVCRHIAHPPLVTDYLRRMGDSNPRGL